MEGVVCSSLDSNGLLTAPQGVLHMSKRSSQEAVVQLGSQATSLLRQVVVKGQAALNRAMHGDTVAGALALYPVSCSAKTSDIMKYVERYI